MNLRTWIVVIAFITYMVGVFAFGVFLLICFIRGGFHQ